MIKRTFVIVIIFILISCTIHHPRLPDGWSIVDTKKDSQNYSEIIYPAKTIIIYEKWYLTDHIKDVIVKHQIGHVYGADQTSNPMCLMWESEETILTRWVGQPIYYRIVIFPLQSVNMFKFCDQILYNLTIESRESS